jgi:hypothetical protein
VLNYVLKCGWQARQLDGSIYHPQYGRSVRPPQWLCVLL